ncbi:MAG: hypothetical protein QOE89_2701 [Pseudonocardiales bacterium]|nr:hypothetical protein [Pseudonocardiales bacterium]
MSDLSDEGQERITEAITVILTTRQTVNLGFPAVEAPTAADESADDNS